MLEKTIIKLRSCFHRIKTSNFGIDQYGNFEAEMTICTQIYYQGSTNPYQIRMVHIMYASPGEMNYNSIKTIVKATTMII